MSTSPFHPSDADFSIRMSITDPMLRQICRNYEQSRVYSSNMKNYASPETGFIQYGEIYCWVHNQEKQGYMTLYFKTFDDYKQLCQHMDANENIIENIDKPNTTSVHRWCDQENKWKILEVPSVFDSKNLIGRSKSFKLMETDIFNHTKQVEILRTIGETKGLNYLLVGKPNTGKTTFIKALASKHNMDVYVVNGETLKVGTIKQILNPGQKLEKKVLLVVRNFDAFFKDCKHFISPNLLTEINKSLDGKYDSGNTIRIFTSDQSKYNYLPDSITDRFYGIFQFNYPDSEMLREKLIRLIDVLPEEYQCYTENKMEKIDEFISLFSMRENVSLKEFTNYCIKYLFEKNNLDKMIEKFEK